MRVLVTGAAGFIGSRVTRRLVAAGHDVLATARAPTALLEDALGTEVQSLDVLDPGLADRELRADAVLHCATANDVVSRDFEAGLRLSVEGTWNVTQLATRCGIGRVIVLSTLQVYGTELEGEITEDTPTRCETPYALNHLLGEEACRQVGGPAGLAVTLLRPANVHGVPDWSGVSRATLVPECFVREALATGRLALRSSGLQRRNFVSTDEVADACLHVLASPSAGCEVVNVASHFTASIRDVAAMVAAVHRERTGHDLGVSVPQGGPGRANSFSVRSRLESLRPTAAESARRMRELIGRLFDAAAARSPATEPVP